MYRVAVVGDYDSIYGFAALGLDVHPVEDKEEALKLIRRLASEEVAVIYLTEALATALREPLGSQAHRTLRAPPPPRMPRSCRLP